MDRQRTVIGKAVAAAALAALAVVIVLQAPAGAAVSTPTVPQAIAVPPGNVLYLVGHATGYQIYVCQADANGYSWVLQAPWAGLVDDAGQPIAIHFAGPTWQAADNSSVVGARVASAPAPSGTAIPWLLLRAVSNSGPPGGTFSSTTYIQRINTVGGLAPTTGCDAAHVGALAPDFYTADYYFYRAG